MSTTAPPPHRAWRRARRARRHLPVRGARWDRGVDALRRLRGIAAMPMSVPTGTDGDRSDLPEPATRSIDLLIRRRLPVQAKVLEEHQGEAHGHAEAVVKDDNATKRHQVVQVVEDVLWQGGAGRVKPTSGGHARYALSRPRTTCVFQKLPSTLNTAKGLDATLTKAGSVLSKSPGYRCTSSGSTAP